MSEKGWVCIDRKILDHWLWQRRPFSEAHAWIDLILLANHKDSKFMYDGKVIEGKKGVVYRSYSYLSERWGWDRRKTRRFLSRLEADRMVSLNGTGDGTTNGTTDGTTHGTTITIVNYSDYQDIGTNNGTTNSTEDFPEMVQPMGNRWATDGQTVPTYNHYNHYNNDNQYIGIGNNYTSLAVDDGNKQPLGSCITQPTISEYDEIVREWNSIPHTISIDGIIPGTKREDELRVVISMYGMDGLRGAIQRVKDSVYLQRIGHVKYDSYINRNVVQKLLEGSYDDDYGTQRGGYTGELGIDWEAVEHDSSQLSSC